MIGLTLPSGRKQRNESSIMKENSYKFYKLWKLFLFFFFVTPIQASQIVASEVIAAPQTSSSTEVQNTWIPVACKPTKKTLVLVAFGQSNAANHGDVAYECKHNVINYYLDKNICYKAKDPLLGATNDPRSPGGSIWSRLGDLLIESGKYDQVVIAPIAIDGSFAQEWAPGGQYFSRILAVSSQLAKLHLKVSAYLWIQGEAEAAFDPDTVKYKATITSMIEGMRSAGFKAPVYIAIATTCRNSMIGADYEFLNENERLYKLVAQQAIEQAQFELINPAKGILLGPNLDLISARYARKDYCHLNAFGQQTAAAMWRSILLQETPLSLLNKLPKESILKR